MPIPEFNEIKAPALQFFTDGKPHRISEIYEVLAGHFKLTEVELNELLPSGTQRRWHNRANWACYDLYRAGLLDRPKRGTYVITEAGRKIAERKPAVIDREFLMRFPQFAAFAQATGPKKDNAEAGADSSENGIALEKKKTPEELMGEAFQVLQSTLKKEVLDLDFADTAVAYAKKVSQKVILIDGERLADLMIQHNIGISQSHSFEVKHIDSDYFEQE